jgi:hypothetical protein
MILERAPKGGNEDTTMDFVRRHDEYENAAPAPCCCGEKLREETVGTRADLRCADQSFPERCAPLQKQVKQYVEFQWRFCLV